MDSWQSATFASVMCICLTTFCMFFVWIVVDSGKQKKVEKKKAMSEQDYFASLPMSKELSGDKTIVFPRVPES